ncbi:MAG: hypothetical protein J6Z06_07115 [Lachnospiraceae bacterium]|nr:hypothetical protein [Lachnospiraceae bacterium]
MTKTYEKPLVIENEDLAEGVFAASGDAGSTDCWTVTQVTTQDWNGSHHVFEIRAIHSSDVLHISSNVDYVFTLNSTVSDAYSEFTTSFSGNTVSVSRTLLADAYKSGDAVTFKVWVKSLDEATTKGLDITGITYTCKHEVNVQGGDD